MSEQGTTRELPRYQCHKQVWALKIKAVQIEAALGEKGIHRFWLVPEEEGYAPFEVSPEYMAKHNPEPGGYWVQYMDSDNYQSYSPAGPFEAGYSRI